MYYGGRLTSVFLPTHSLEGGVNVILSEPKHSTTNLALFLLKPLFLCVRFNLGVFSLIFREYCSHDHTACSQKLVGTYRSMWYREIFDQTPSSQIGADSLPSISRTDLSVPFRSPVAEWLFPTQSFRFYSLRHGIHEDAIFSAHWQPPLGSVHRQRSGSCRTRR